MDYEIDLPDYRALYHSAVVSTAPRAAREIGQACNVALVHADIYKAVERMVKVPWPLIAAIHYRESDQSFTRHLHNGDPLAARTVHVPKGRPVLGTPPFTWIESAADALAGEMLPVTWSIESALEFLERYNGLGYLMHGIQSPYLWDYTNHYKRGLYTGDGHLDPQLIEQRPGCVALIKTLSLKGVSLDFATDLNGIDCLH